MAADPTNVGIDDDTGDWLTNSVESSELDDTGTWASSLRGTTPATADAPIEASPVKVQPPAPTRKAQKPEPAKSEPAKSEPAKSEPRKPKPTKPPKPEHRKPDVARSLRKERPPKRPLWRGRIIPKTVLGISFTMLTTGLAMAVSGVLLFMNYQYRENQTEALLKNFPAQVRAAQRAVANEGINARAQVQQELDPLRKLAATAETLGTVLQKTGPSIFSVRTFDVDGQPTAGSAFVVASDDEKSFLLTSLSVVRAATTKPGPKLILRQGTEELEATLWTWQEDKDLALLIVNSGNRVPLSWAAPDSTRLGDQIFAVSGVGSQNGAITEGRIADVSSSGLMHSAQMGTAFRGGPLLDGQGRVIAIGSRSYAPLGFASEGVFFAPLVQAACETILKCTSGRVEGAGAQR